MTSNNAPIEDYDPSALDAFLSDNPDLEQSEKDIAEAGKLNSFIKRGDLDGFIAAFKQAMETPAIIHDLMSGVTDHVTLGEVWAMNYGPVLEKYENISAITGIVLESENLLRELPKKVRFVLIDVLFSYYHPDDWGGWRMVVKGAGHTHDQINALIVQRVRRIYDDGNTSFRPEEHLGFLRMLMEPARDPRHSYRPFETEEDERLIVAVLRRFLPDEKSAIDRMERRMRFTRTAYRL